MNAIISMVMNASRANNIVTNYSHSLLFATIFSTQNPLSSPQKLASTASQVEGKLEANDKAFTVNEKDTARKQPRGGEQTGVGSAENEETTRRCKKKLFKIFYKQDKKGLSK